MWSVFRGPHTITFTLQGKFYICACALTVYIPKTTRQILQDNTWTESPNLKNLCVFCSWMPVWCVKNRVYVQLSPGGSKIYSEVGIVSLLSPSIMAIKLHILSNKMWRFCNFAILLINISLHKLLHVKSASHRGDRGWIDHGLNEPGAITCFDKIMSLSSEVDEAQICDWLISRTL